MAILLENLDIVEWMSHDADIHSLKIYWSDSGDMLVGFRCEISPEESREPLFEIGINTPIIDVQFCNVWRLTTDITGDIASREVVLDWCIIEPSPFITQIRNNGMAINLKLLHHQIKCSGGSVIDVVFERILLNEVNT